MAAQMSATTHLNRGLRIFFSEFARVSLRHPSQALFFARTVFWQAGAARRRAREARDGLHVPPISDRTLDSDGRRRSRNGLLVRIVLAIAESRQKVR